MLNRLRRNMTLLCAAATGAILLLVGIVSLSVSEGQLAQRGQALFQSSLNAISFRLRTEGQLDWAWLAQTEVDGRLVIHIEDNGSPLLYSGNWMPPDSREWLVVEAQRTAREDYGVDVATRPLSSLRGEQAEFTVQGPSGAAYRAAVLVLRTGRGFQSLTLIQDPTDERAAIRSQRVIFLGLGGGSFLLLALFSWWFAGRAISPVAESRQRQSEFIAAASHELRTPLAVIRTSAAALGYGAQGGEARFAEAIERECVRTGRLVDDLLMLANADAGSWRVDLGPVEPEQVLRDCVDSFAALAAERGQELILEPPEEPLPLVAGDEQRMEQLVSILLDNALRYTPAGGRIVLRGRRLGRWVRMEVADDGPGIPREDRERVFQRFFRADASRSKKDHYGLGLSIAREIAQLHRGKIQLLETPGGGLTAAADFRCARP